MVNRIINLASSIVLIVFVKLSWDFVLVEAEFGKEVFLGIHSRFLVGIIPFGFSIIGIRFILKFILSFDSKNKGAH